MTIFARNVPDGVQPNYVVAGGRAQIEIWTSFFGELDQVRMTHPDRTVRAIFDEFGELALIQDESDGSFITVNDLGNGRVDFYHFDSGGHYQDGYAVFANDGGFAAANVEGTPAFEGQIQGTLSPSSAGQGSFALVAEDTSALSGIVDVTEQMTALLSAMAVPVGDGLAPSFNLSKALKIGGTIILGAGIAGGGGAFAAAGIATIAAGYFANDIANFIENGFSDADPFAQSIANIAVGLLRDPDSIGLVEALKKVVDKAIDIVDGLTPNAGAAELPVEHVDEYEDAPAVRLDETDQPQTDEGPPSIPVDVSGQAAWQDGSTEQLDGTVADDGTVSFDGDGGTSVDGEINDDGTISGTYQNDSGENGTVTGTVGDVGACSLTQNSGGQGAFTNAHFVGRGVGISVFTYDAYSIPDAFAVSVGRAEVFSTGGLVSGSSSESISMNGEGFVFVSVTAPDADTAWDYSVGCVE